MQSHPVWDIPSRLFHWTLVFAVLLSWLSYEEDYFQVHLWSGYTVLLLVCFRIVWGVVGSVHSRFSDFLRGPASVVRYIRSKQWNEVGHNPLGAWSVVAMLALLLVQAISGLFNSDDLLYDGPLNHLLDSAWTDKLGELHATLFYVIAGLIGLHIASVLFYQLGRRVDLLGPMIHGGDGGRSAPVSLLRAIAVACLLVLIFSVLLSLVPEPEPLW